MSAFPREPKLADKLHPEIRTWILRLFELPEVRPSLANPGIFAGGSLAFAKKIGLRPPLSIVDLASWRPEADWDRAAAKFSSSSAKPYPPHSPYLDDNLRTWADHFGLNPTEAAVFRFFVLVHADPWLPHLLLFHPPSPIEKKHAALAHILQIEPRKLNRALSEAGALRRLGLLYGPEGHRPLPLAYYPALPELSKILVERPAPPAETLSAFFDKPPPPDTPSGPAETASTDEARVAELHRQLSPFRATLDQGDQDVHALIHHRHDQAHLRALDAYAHLAGFQLRYLNRRFGPWEIWHYKAQALSRLASFLFARDRTLLVVPDAHKLLACLVNAPLPTFDHPSIPTLWLAPRNRSHWPLALAPRFSAVIDLA